MVLSRWRECAWADAPDRVKFALPRLDGSGALRKLLPASIFAAYCVAVLMVPERQEFSRYVAILRYCDAIRDSKLHAGQCSLEQLQPFEPTGFFASPRFWMRVVCGSVVEFAAMQGFWFGWLTRGA